MDVVRHLRRVQRRTLGFVHGVGDWVNLLVGEEENWIFIRSRHASEYHIVWLAQGRLLRG